MNQLVSRAALNEARGTLDKQIQGMNNLDEKAARLFRLELLILSLIIAVSSIVNQSSDYRIIGFINPYIAGGIGMLLISSLFAAITYSASQVRSGMNHRDIENLLKTEREVHEFYKELLRSYAEWIRANQIANARNALQYTLAFITSIFAIILLILGIITSVVSLASWIPVSTAIISIILLVVVSGVYTQTKRLLKLLLEDNSGDKPPTPQHLQNFNKNKIKVGSSNGQAKNPTTSGTVRENYRSVERTGDDGSFEGAITAHGPYENSDQKEPKQKPETEPNQTSKNQWKTAVIRGVVTGVVRGVIAGIVTALLDKMHEWYRRSVEKKEND